MHSPELREALGYEARTDEQLAEWKLTQGYRANCCENRLRSGITSSRVVSIVVDYDYDYGNDRV